jgi:hypothetical protein
VEGWKGGEEEREEKVEGGEKKGRDVKKKSVALGH